MTDSTLTLADLVSPNHPVDSARLRLGGSDGALQDGGGFLNGKIHEGIASALDVNVLEVIAEAWAQTDELRRAAGAQHGAGQPAHLFLAKHEVSCDSRLDVTLEFLGARAVTDHLNLRLKAMFEGVGVTIDHDCIVAVDAGRASAKAELLYSDASLFSESTDWVSLPATWVLPRPIRIVH